MITPTGNPAPVRGTMGQYAAVSAGWNSDVVLTGKTIGFNPGLFTASPQPPGGVVAYTVSYPAVPGIYPMTFTAPPAWINGRVEIEVIDGFNFRIILRFFYTTLINYVSGLVPPGLPFQGSGFYGSGSSNIAMYVTVNGATSTVLIPVTANDFGNQATAVVSYESGIRVDIETPLAAESVAFMGLYSENDFNRKAYAQISSTPGRIDGLDADAFITASPFVASQGVSRAYFTIDATWLSDGVNYYAYVVYKSGGVWYSTRSEVITRGGGRPIIYGDVSYLIRDDTNNYTTGCVSDAPPCKSFSVAATMDALTYNAALADAGLDGSQSTKFLGCRATVQQSLTGGQGGENLQVTVTENANGITAFVDPFIPSPGVEYVVFGFRYFFPDGEDLILVPVQISTTPYAQLVGPEELCVEDEGTVTVQLPETLGTVMVTQRDGNGPGVAAQGVTISGTNFNIDSTTIPLGVSRCFDICSEAVTSVQQDCVCDCDCISVAVLINLLDNTGAYNYQVSVAFPVSGSNVDAFSVGSVGAASQNQSGVTLVEGSGTAQRNGSTFVVYLSGQIALNDGCVYDIPLQTAQLTPGSQYDNANIQICIASCDCDEVPEPDPTCENMIAITADCTDGTLAFTAEEDFNSVVATDITECSVNGEAYDACAASYTEGETVTIRRRVTFSDGCPAIESTLTANCEVINNCENSAELVVDKTDVLLTLSLTTDYSSPVGTEDIYYSLNGGLAYQVYSAPVTLEGNENIRAYSVTTFTDGCPDVVTPSQSAGGLTVDNTEPLVEYCNGDGEITGFAALIGTSPNIETIYFDTDMVQTPTVPEGSPCETYVPCATCP